MGEIVMTPLPRCLLCLSDRLRPRWDRLPVGIRIVVCDQCGLAFQPDPGDVRTIYGQTYHTRWAERGVAKAKQETYLYMMNKLPWPKGHGVRVLDVGCALGDSLEAIETFGAEAWGVEYSASLQNALTDRWKTHVKIGDFLEASLPAEGFYAIGMIDVIEHFLNPRDVLKHCWDLLEPGGWFFMGTPDFGGWIRKILGKYWEQFKPEHVTYFTYRNLADVMTQMGFKVHHGGNFRKKLHVGYFLTIVSYHSPWLIPSFVVPWAKKWPWFWNLKLWVPTDGFILLAQKPASPATSTAPAH